ncbi:MAG: preprotein translocase subunit SecG [Francisellaceae bacterium]
MLAFLLTLHIIVAVLIIGLVLLQQGKGATMGASFGSGASQTVFGSRGAAPFLFKLTAFLVAVFFVTSVSLSYIGKHSAGASSSDVATQQVTQSDYEKYQAQKQQTIDQATQQKPENTSNTTK